MKLSYLVTVHNETDSLEKSVFTIASYKDDIDEIIILDDHSEDPKTKEILKKWQYAQTVATVDPVTQKPKTIIPNVRVIQHALNKNYGEHKNYGNKECSGEWIFQIDGDEIPRPMLVANIKSIIEANPTMDLIYVPRINDFIGVTPAHAATWGWKLTRCPECDNRPIVNWPDFQSRIYRRDPDRIKWDRRLHEKIEGHDKFTMLPADTDLALYHDKTIETQLATNKRYNEWFTAEENQGHDVFSKK